jgi:23S rRNA (adenine2503-C2)-methyltransferase
VQSLPIAPDSLREGASSSAAFGLTPRELAERGFGAGTFRALQRPWTYDAGGPALSLEKRARLVNIGIALPELRRCERSSDGSNKLVLGFGRNEVEAVHMPRDVRGGRVTLCVSSQVGCAMGCSFCATARMGFVRHLTAGEIVAQIARVVHALGPRHPGELTLVFMGMGEPLHNLDAVARAIRVLCDPLGLGISPRRMTLSTSGLVPELDELARLESRPLLAVSLNATTDATRAALMPVNRRYPLAELRAALARYPLRPRERITIEYVLLAGVNDTPDDAVRLAEFCRPFSHQINLIPWNAHEHAEFSAPAEPAIDAFARRILTQRKTVVTVRRSRGQDVRGACGQLALA